MSDLTTRTHERAWLCDQNLRKLCSGEVDRIIYSCWLSEGIIFDFKTLFGEHEEASDNLQLMTLAVIFSGWYDLKKVYVCLVQPWKKGQFTLAVYDQTQLQLAKDALLAILDAAKKPDAPRHPGPYCKFCRALSICPEAQGQLWAMKLMSEGPLTQPAQLVKFWDVWQMVKARGEKLETLIKERLQSGEEIPGLALKPGNKRRVIPDAGKAYLALKDSMAAAEFAACCSVSIGDLEKGFLEAFKAQMTNKKLRKSAMLNELESRLGDALEYKQNAPSVVRVKDEPLDLIP